MTTFRIAVSSSPRRGQDAVQPLLRPALAWPPLEPEPGGLPTLHGDPVELGDPVQQEALVRLLDVEHGLAAPARQGGEQLLIWLRHSL